MFYNKVPSQSPTDDPTQQPSIPPTNAPTQSPTNSPSMAPIIYNNQSRFDSDCEATMEKDKITLIIKIQRGGIILLIIIIIILFCINFSEYKSRQGYMKAITQIALSPTFNKIQKSTPSTPGIELVSTNDMLND